MSFDQLPFVGTVDGRPSAWVPKRSGDYANDCETGRLHFTALSALMSQSGNRTLLGRVLQAQVAGGKWEAVEIGFAQALSDHVSMQ